MADQDVDSDAGSLKAREEGSGGLPGWLIALAVLLVLLLLALLLFLLLGDDDEGGDDEAAVDPAASVEPTATPEVTPEGAGTPSPADVASPTDAPSPTGAEVEPSPTATPPDGASPTAGAPGAGDAAAGPVLLSTSDGQALLPLPAQGLDQLVGASVSEDPVPVESVPVDEGFWAGDSTDNRIWVRLTGEGESEADVDPGERASLAGGVVRAVDEEFLSQLQVPADQAQLIREQGIYVEVAKDAVTVP